jgi:hypothetical protein
MILIITGIGLLIHIYSTAYMHEETDAEYARYFSYLNLFAAFMLVLVLGANFLVMFVGWEGSAFVVPAHRLLVPEAIGIRRRQEGFHRQPYRRLGVPPWCAAHVRALRIAGLPGRGAKRGRAEPRNHVRHDVGHHAAHVRRRDGQVRADSAVRLAPGRDGGPDARLGAHPGDDGDGGGVHDWPECRCSATRR